MNVVTDVHHRDTEAAQTESNIVILSEAKDRPQFGMPIQ
jgi:hypothetical protein